MNFIYPIGATPIEGDELEALIPQHISLQQELNEWESANILEAEKWGFEQRHADLLSLDFIQRLHTKMFNESWRWAGQFRKTLKNIGIIPYEIPQELLKLCMDVRYHIDHTVYSFDEIAARFHHRLVWIHPFPNGNGRHARIYKDILLIHHQKDRFTWGRGDLMSQSQTRKLYIHALKQADQHDYIPLLEFVRS